MNLWGGIIFPVAVGALTGVVSGFGIGGGTLLILYLTLVMHLPQQAAQGVNLVYFLCCAPAALYYHFKHRLVVWKPALAAIAAGCLTSVGAAYLANNIETDPLRRMFGVVLLWVGGRELFAKRPERKAEGKAGR